MKLLILRRTVYHKITVPFTEGNHHFWLIFSSCIYCIVCKHLRKIYAFVRTINWSTMNPYGIYAIIRNNHRIMTYQKYRISVIAHIILFTVRRIGNEVNCTMTKFWVYCIQKHLSKYYTCIDVFLLRYSNVTHIIHLLLLMNVMVRH